MIRLRWRGQKWSIELLLLVVGSWGPVRGLIVHRWGSIVRWLLYELLFWLLIMSCCNGKEIWLHI